MNVKDPWPWAWILLLDTVSSMIKAERSELCNSKEENVLPDWSLLELGMSVKSIVVRRCIVIYII